MRLCRTPRGRSPSLHRGDVEQPAKRSGRGGLSCVPGLDPIFALSLPRMREPPRGAGGLDHQPGNVLTWRSIVNRIWHYHFGRGTCRYANDFGRNGSLPTHPELLDWLAVEFRDGGQSFKRFTG